MDHIRISTPREFLAQQHALSLYCRPCDRWTEADLRQLVDAGRGDQAIQRMRFTCKDCGSRMEAQVRPPTMRE